MLRIPGNKGVWSCFGLALLACEDMRIMSELVILGLFMHTKSEEYFLPVLAALELVLNLCCSYAKSHHTR